jgi:hypothetical protein
MVHQSSDIKELLEWVHLTLAFGYLSFRPSAMDAIRENGLNLQDVVHVLETSTNVSTDFAQGCFTFRGPTPDCEAVAVVIAERGDKSRIKLIKAWRE